MKKPALWLWHVIQNQPGFFPVCKGRAAISNPVAECQDKAKVNRQGLPSGALSKFTCSSAGFSGPSSRELCDGHCQTASPGFSGPRVQMPQGQPRAFTPMWGVRGSAPPLPSCGVPPLLHCWGLVLIRWWRELSHGNSDSQQDGVPSTGSRGGMAPEFFHPQHGSSPATPGCVRPRVHAASISASGGNHCPQLAARRADGARPISQFQGPYKCHCRCRYRVVTITCDLSTSTPGNRPCFPGWQTVLAKCQPNRWVMVLATTVRAMPSCQLGTRC